MKNKKTGGVDLDGPYGGYKFKDKKHNRDCKDFQPMIGKNEGYVCICDSKPSPRLSEIV